MSKSYKPYDSLYEVGHYFFSIWVWLGLGTKITWIGSFGQV